jgi:hypothetical protein
MTLAEAKKLKVGDKVKWPAGANKCPEAIGIVLEDPFTDSLYVMWPDTPEQRTYLHDEHAVKYLVKP